MIHLYVKKCGGCGLKYFGATTKLDPFKYKGSGIGWRLHFKSCDIDCIETLAVYSFLDRKECKEFALHFSKENQIVESSDWANRIYEDGQTGTWPSTYGPRIGWVPPCKNKTWKQAYGDEKAALMSARASKSKKYKTPNSHTLWKAGEEQKWNKVPRIHITNGVQNTSIRNGSEADIPTGWWKGTTRRRISSTPIKVITPDNTFKSISEAARFYGISDSIVGKRVRSPRFPYWNFVE